jgi:hypothetical protein
MYVRILFFFLLSTWFFPSPALAAIQVVFDYRFDSTGFFAGENSYRRQVLESAATSLTSRLKGSLPSIAPSGTNHWALSFRRPDTGQSVSLPDLALRANEVRIFVGARPMFGFSIGLSEYNLNWSGDRAWNRSFYERILCVNNFDSVGGAITFNSVVDWYFDSNPTTTEDMGPRQDFFSEAVHEIAHLLGFTKGAAAFAARTEGTLFVGTAATGLFGGEVPLASNQNNFPDSLSWEGQQVAMAYTLNLNTRRYFTELDFAALEDIGYKETTGDCTFRIQREGDRVRIAWPVFPRGFILESAGINVLPYQWELVKANPSTSNDVNTIELETSGPGRIYRLIKR